MDFCRVGLVRCSWSVRVWVMWVWWVDPPEDLAPRLSGEGEKAGFFFFFLSVMLCGWWSE